MQNRCLVVGQRQRLAAELVTQRYVELVLVKR